MAQNDNSMKRILEELNLNHLIPIFLRESIDCQTFLSLTESQINQLGVTKIGDKARLTDKVRLELQNCPKPKEKERPRDEGGHERTSSSIASNILHQRNTLFNPKKSKTKKRPHHVLPDLDDHEEQSQQPKPKKVKRGPTRSWTINVVCLANKDAKTVPSPLDREVLFKAGLGQRKITFTTDDKESDVLQKITSDAVQENETVGFPQLNDCGGFELLYCRQNTRELNIVECDWSVRNLKCFLGPQAKLYLRPIQKDLSIDPIEKLTEEQAKTSCQNCKMEISIRELRNHLVECKQSFPEAVGCDNSATGTLSDSASSDLEDFKIQPCQPLRNYDQVVESGPIIDPCNQLEEVQQLDKESTSSTCTSKTNYLHAHVDSDPIIEENQLQESQQLNEESTKSTSSAVKTDDQIGDSDPIIIIINNHNDKQEVEAMQSTHTSSAAGIDNLITQTIETIFNENIQDPVEILRFIQGKILTGRKLDNTGDVTENEGETNFIMVSRMTILNTAIEEIREIPDADLRKTLEVQFYDEAAQDFGGPRREFFRLVLAEIKTKYFENGLREYMAADYIIVGKILALSILQNGSMPTFLGEEILKELFSGHEPEAICIKNLRIGFDCLGLIRIGTVIPAFVHLLRPSTVVLTMKSVLHILKPLFSEAGSNTRVHEDDVYSAFVKYVRSVGSGRRPGLALSNIIEFVTGASEEPVLGFSPQPSIAFVPVREDLSFIPTANTCSNSMSLPRPSTENALPKEERLFELYDYAFKNAYYGLV